MWGGRFELPSMSSWGCNWQFWKNTSSKPTADFKKLKHPKELIEKKIRPLILYYINLWGMNTRDCDSSFLKRSRTELEEVTTLSKVWNIFLTEDY